MTEAIFKYREARAGELGLFPVDEEGADIIHRIKVGKDVGCDVKQRRNPRHHRLFFAIIRFLQLHAERFENVPTEVIKVAVKIATGFGNTFVDLDTGKTIFVPRSISFAATDQTEFTKFFDDACMVIATRWMPEGVTATDVRRELLAMVDGPGAQGSKVA